MFKLFETIVSPFPDEPVVQPPKSLISFVWHYTKPFRFLLFALLVTSAIIAAIEVYMFSTIGQIIDWMQTSEPSTFFESHGSTLLTAGLIIMVVWPLMNYVDSCIEHQGLLGNFAMQIRWRTHRYLLRQSTSFFSNDFSGRIATKVMQTSLSVRDSVVSLNGLVVYLSLIHI